MSHENDYFLSTRTNQLVNTEITMIFCFAHKLEKLTKFIY